MSKILKVGVIGVGGIAKTHMPGWAASEHAEVVAGSDVMDSVLQSWGQQHGVTLGQHDLGEQLFLGAKVLIERRF